MRALALVWLAFPVIAGAQQTERCTWEAKGGQRIIEIAPGVRNIYLSRTPAEQVLLRCPDRGIRITSDSLESYEGEGRVFLIGNVRYSEPRLTVNSDFLTYFQRDERVLASGNVRARLPNGSTLVGPTAEYLRATPSTRPVERIIATGRPTITLVQRDTTAATPPPTVVNANNVTMVGDSLVYAGGQVVVTREDVIARSDSMALDSEREITVLLRNATIDGRRDRPFQLAGTRIELTGADRKLRRVLAVLQATATSEDLVLSSDTIDLRVERDLLQRAVAWGPSRARAASAQQNLLADSIDVVMPDQRIREMYAVRGALAQGRPDTTRFRADTLDWMRGDTIVARFDTLQSVAVAPVDSAVRDTAGAAPRDTANRARLEELHAVGNAKSYYHLAPADSSLRRPAINYVTGREIVVDFEAQRVDKVTVIEQASGVYLEPAPVTAQDTSRARETRPGASPGATQPAAGPPTTPPPARPPIRRPE